MKQLFLLLLLSLPAFTHTAHACSGSAADTSTQEEDTHAQLLAFSDTCGFVRATHNRGTKTAAECALLLFKRLRDPQKRERMLPHLTPDILNTINALAVPALKKEAAEILPPESNARYQYMTDGKDYHYFVSPYNLLARMVPALHGPFVEGRNPDCNDEDLENTYRKPATMLVPGDTPGTFKEIPIPLFVKDLVATKNIAIPLKMSQQGDVYNLLLRGQGLTSLAGLEKVPDKDIITWLACRGNLIQEIPHCSLAALSRLNILDLTTNGICIQDGMFDNLPELLILCLGNFHKSTDHTQHNNSLTTLTTKTFTGLPKLKSVSLKNVGLASIEPDALAGLPSLKDVDLSYNKLAILDAAQAKQTWGVQAADAIIHLDHQQPS